MGHTQSTGQSVTLSGVKRSVLDVQMISGESPIENLPPYDNVLSGDGMCVHFQRKFSWIYVVHGGTEGWKHVRPITICICTVGKFKHSPLQLFKFLSITVTQDL